MYKSAYLYPFPVPYYDTYMGYIYRTNVPNMVFDVHLKDLGYAELKVLLVVIRQTYGWKDPKTNSYKRWDWISQRFFVKKTGLSQRSVSTAISRLVENKDNVCQ